MWNFTKFYILYEKLTFGVCQWRALEQPYNTNYCCLVLYTPRPNMNHNLFWGFFFSRSRKNRKKTFAARAMFFCKMFRIFYDSWWGAGYFECFTNFECTVIGKHRSPKTFNLWSKRRPRGALTKPTKHMKTICAENEQSGTQLRAPHADFEHHRPQYLLEQLAYVSVLHTSDEDTTSEKFVFCTHANTQKP